jgi:hypothetical protein
MIPAAFGALDQMPLTPGRRAPEIPACPATTGVDAVFMSLKTMLSAFAPLGGYAGRRAPDACALPAHSRNP